MPDLFPLDPQFYKYFLYYLLRGGSVLKIVIGKVI
jgi:hypothetical protein